MRRPILIAIAATIVSTASAFSADELPLRKAGQWELKTEMEEGGKRHEQMLTMCVDADMERKTAMASDAEHKQSCSKYEVKKSGDSVVVVATCSMNGRDVESRTEMSGDFKTAFDVKIDSTTSGIDGAQSISVKRTITQHGKFLSESCGELKAGEAMGSDGSKVMVQ